MYYIYEIKNNINNKTYIGQHKTNDLNDDYMGSGTLLHRAYEKYGKENFTKRIFAICETSQNANILEKVFIALYRVDGKAEYNIADGGNGGNLGNVVNEKIRNSIILLYENNPDIKIKISDKSKLRVGDKNPFYGHKHSEKSLNKMSDSHKGCVAWNKGIPRDLETKKKISEIVTEKMKNPEVRKKISESCKGRKAWNLGLKMTPMSDDTKLKMSEKLRNKRWYTNGVKDVFVEKCPEGFVSGRSFYIRSAK